MKIVIINHSDTRGGASVVSYRLMKALRALGHDASMLVGHKATDDPDVHLVGKRGRLKAAFLAEELRIFAGNGLNRSDMFKVSIGSAGLPLSRHPLVRQADAVILAWVNQGLLSLRECARIAAEKPTYWAMHDMWCLTGICHHAGTCRRYTAVPGCGYCPLLHWEASRRDLSRRTWSRKVDTYAMRRIHFVPVSSWLRDRCKESSLMRGQHISLIPNAFPVEDFYIEPKSSRQSLGLPEGKKLILMGAARLDDPVKGLPYAIEALNGLDRDDVHAVFFGALRDPHALDGLRLPHTSLGTVSSPDVLHELYAHASVVLSSSLYETLPGTLIEGQAAGCMPVAFDSGGQRDIISTPAEGILVPPYSTTALTAALTAALDTPTPPALLRQTVSNKFSAPAVARQWLALLTSH